MESKVLSTNAKLRASSIQIHSNPDHPQSVFWPRIALNMTRLQICLRILGSVNRKSGSNALESMLSKG